MKNFSFLSYFLSYYYSNNYYLKFYFFFFFIFFSLFNYINGFDINWDYYPKDILPKYGIIMASTKTKLELDSRYYIPICIAKLYALHYKYAFTFYDDLGGVNNRGYGKCSSYNMSAWNKIPLMEKYLNDVEVLVWIDLDAIITRFDVSLDQILPSKWEGSSCNLFNDIRELGTDIDISNQKQRPGLAFEPFFWVTIDINPMYSININTAVMAIKRGDLGQKFLKEVWKTGNNPNLFKEYDPNWETKSLCVNYWGWPWEQGGVWSVLKDSKQLQYLQGTCVLPHRGKDALNSIFDQWKDGISNPYRPFILHNPSSNEFEYWLIYIMRRYFKSYLDLQQVCHSSIPKRYKEIIERLNKKSNSNL